MSNSSEYTVLKTNRFERKFVIPNWGSKIVEHHIKALRFGFRSIFKPRKVNNIYFDTPNFNNYYDNHFGRSKRRKMRIRWYGETFTKVENPILEVKIKSGAVGSKLSFPLNSFDMSGKSISKSALQEVFTKSNLPESILIEIKGQVPTLINCYQRQYLANLDKKFRFTIDTNLKYFRTDRFNTSNLVSMLNKELVIVELKYDEENDSKGKEIGTKLPFRLDKFSKYVNGVDALNEYLTV
mgnify:FL=1